MQVNFLILIGFFIYLFFVNIALSRFNFSLDIINKKEPHKKFLNKNEKKIPLVGFFYFFPIILTLFVSKNMTLVIFTLIFFLIGLLSDIKLLSSPKKRFFLQLITIVLFIILNSNLNLDTRIEFLNTFQENFIFKVFFISFCFLVLINGTNFIDGVNGLASLNILSSLFFAYLLAQLYQNDNLFNDIKIIIFSIFIFLIFNLCNKYFLGDAGTYGLSFIVGYLLLSISNLSHNISPYFMVNLLWYPAFENLFTILRRTFLKKKKYLPDNFHFHHLLFKYFFSKFNKFNIYLSSSFTGTIINIYLFISSFICYLFHSKTNIQISILLLNVLIYMTCYIFLKKKND